MKRTEAENQLPLLEEMEQLLKEYQKLLDEALAELEKTDLPPKSKKTPTL